MYVPPLEAILVNLGVTREVLATSESISIPVSLFRFLLQLAIVNSDFNEANYLKLNPDIAKAVQNGSIASPHLHYLGDGYFEGRTGGVPPVDEKWYLRTYPDVAGAVKTNRIGSATEHFLSVGASELRAPGQQYELDAVEWGKALGKDR